MHELGIAVLTALNSVLSQPSEATLLFAGDAMMHAKQIEVAYRGNGIYDFSDYFTAVKPLISEADYAVVNLETPVAKNRYSGYPMFNAPDAYVDALMDAGFDMMLTANNHTLDRRDSGLRRTIHTLDSLGVHHLGTYANKSQRDKMLPMIKDINGFKVAFLNYTYGTNGISIQGDVVVDYISREQMKSDISKARDKGAELVCVAVHWGEEYKMLPNASQRSLADFLLAQGVDLVIGGHPHVIQPMELRANPEGGRQLLVYSLGNFISNMRTRDTRGGAIVRAHLRRDADGNAYVDRADYDLVFTIAGTGREDNFRLVFADSCDVTGWTGRCKEFTSSARHIFDAHNKDVPKRK